MKHIFYKKGGIVLMYVQSSGVNMDTTPTQNSENAIASGGVYTSLQSKQSKLTFDSTPTSGSSNVVTSGGVYTAISNVTPTITTTDPGEGSTLASGTVLYVVS